MTDVYGGLVEGLNYIARHARDVQHKFVPQITQREHYAKVIALGYHSVIWTLYSQQDDPLTIASFAATHPLFAVTLNPGIPNLKRVLTLLGELGCLRLFAHHQ